MRMHDNWKTMPFPVKLVFVLAIVIVITWMLVALRDAIMVVLGG